MSSWWTAATFAVAAESMSTFQASPWAENQVAPAAAAWPDIW